MKKNKFVIYASYYIVQERKRIHFKWIKGPKFEWQKFKAFMEENPGIYLCDLI